MTSQTGYCFGQLPDLTAQGTGVLDRKRCFTALVDFTVSLPVVTSTVLIASSVAVLMLAGAQAAPAKPGHGRRAPGGI